MTDFNLPLGILLFGVAATIAVYAVLKRKPRKEYEERTVTTDEGNRLVNQGRAKFIAATPDGQMIVSVEKKVPEQKTIQEVPIEKVPGKIQYEIVEQKDQRTIIIKKGKISKKQLFKTFKKRDYFPNHIIKETTGTGKKAKVRYYVRWHRFSSEAYDVNGGITHDEDLENFLMNDMVVQFRDAAITLAGLNIDKTMMIILVMAMVFGIPIGLSYNDIFHWVPSTVVHWVTRR